MAIHNTWLWWPWVSLLIQWALPHGTPQLTFQSVTAKHHSWLSVPSLLYMATSQHRPSLPLAPNGDKQKRLAHQHSLVTAAPRGLLVWDSQPPHHSNPLRSPLQTHFNGIHHCTLPLVWSAGWGLCTASKIKRERRGRRHSQAAHC